MVFVFLPFTLLLETMLGLIFSSSTEFVMFGKLALCSLSVTSFFLKPINSPNSVFRRSTW